MESPSRIDLAIAAPIGLALFAAAFIVALVAGVLHPALRTLSIFALAFPLLWVAAATILSFSTAGALRIVSVEIPTQMRAMETFQLNLTLALGEFAFPGIGIMTNTKFSTGDVTIEAGPWAEIPILDMRRAAMSRWDVTVKTRGMLFVGPVRAAIELPGSAIRATAIFEGTHSVRVLPAIYHLQPFVDTLLSGRHIAVARFQKLPSAIEEYVGAREYRPGDSPKLIHRILSLRARDPDQFFVREFQDPSREDLCLVLDTAPPLDGDGSLHRYRLEKAICFVSALCRTFAARRLAVRFVYQRAARDMVGLRLRPLDADLNRLDFELAQIELRGDRGTLGRALLAEVQRFGAAVIFVSLRPRESVEQQRLPIVTLTPDHVPVFTREVVMQ